MSYNLPTFNLTANIWRFANYPADPPTLTSLANLVFGGRTNPVGGSDVIANVFVLLPKDTDIRDSYCLSTTEGDIVELPAGTGRIYITLYVDDSGKGFSNEHRIAILQKFGNSWPVPIP